MAARRTAAPHTNSGLAATANRSAGCKLYSPLSLLCSDYNLGVIYAAITVINVRQNCHANGIIKVDNGIYISHNVPLRQDYVFFSFSRTGLIRK